MSKLMCSPQLTTFECSFSLKILMQKKNYSNQAFESYLLDVSVGTKRVQIVRNNKIESFCLEH